MRFYEARGGVVAIDGHDVTSLDPAWLRSRLAFVQQEPVLFGVNVRENVAYALAAADARRARAARAPREEAADMALVPDRRGKDVGACDADARWGCAQNRAPTFRIK